MAENSSEDKTEEGSEKKIRDALESGNVPMSREASVLFSLAALLILSSFILAKNAQALVAALTNLFASPIPDPLSSTADALVILHLAATACFDFLWPLLLLIMAAGVIASLAQGLPRVALNRIAPKWSKLSPGQGLRRLLGRDGQIEFLKSLVKFCAVAGVAFLVLQGQAQEIVALLHEDPATFCTTLLSISAKMLAGLLVAHVVLTSGDLVWARIKWRRDLKMTRHEVKEEHKQAEGDPLLKAKRRSLALDRSRRRMIAAVPRATMVIANPTHFAIALRYVREEGGAPIVVAKGQDLVALKIREIAEANDIPVFEDKALARSMYDHVEVDQLIPAEFFKAVAELIHFMQSRKAVPLRTGSLA